MLRLDRREQALTQGQAPGKRVSALVVARAVEIGEVETQVESAPAETGEAGGAPDVQAIARRVYELMRQDLQIEHERRKRRL
jgi:hypothetical protein